jgi:hypothetical protein
MDEEKGKQLAKRADELEEIRMRDKTGIVLSLCCCCSTCFVQLIIVFVASTAEHSLSLHDERLASIFISGNIQDAGTLFR